MNFYAWDAPTTLSRCIASCLAADAPNVMREGLKKGMAWSDRQKGENMIDFRVRACEPVPVRPDESCVEVYAMFAETWASTALGFGGMGGSAMTTAYTVVLMVDQVHLLVYWGGRYAYTRTIGEEGFDMDAFRADLAQRRTRNLQYFKDK